LEPTVLILLAEDELLVGVVVQENLEDAGFTVRHVLSGADALAALDEDATIYSGLVTDIRLGDGPDGWDVARHARELSPTIPVVYMSGDSAHEHSARGVPDSVMLQKPFAAAQLVTAISTLMNEVPPHTAG
jgi:DNA-binding response OmpR family regulator